MPTTAIRLMLIVQLGVGAGLAAEMLAFPIDAFLGTTASAVLTSHISPPGKMQQDGCQLPCGEQSVQSSGCVWNVRPAPSISAIARPPGASTNRARIWPARILARIAGSKRPGGQERRISPLACITLTR